MKFLDYLMNFELLLNEMADSKKDAENFIKQDAQELLKALPQYTNIISNAATTTASYINRFIQKISFGYIGFKQGGLITNI
jgi:hypothetical protein